MRVVAGGVDKELRDLQGESSFSGRRPKAREEIQKEEKEELYGPRTLSPLTTRRTRSVLRSPRRAVFAEAAELGASLQRARKHNRKIAAPHEGKKEDEEEENRRDDEDMMMLSWGAFRCCSPPYLPRSSFCCDSLRSLALCL